MSDYERYMDYDGVHDDDHLLHPPSKWVVVLKILCKCLLALTCIFVVGILVLRMSLAAWYPKSAKELRMTPAISQAHQTHGSLTALTQDMIAPWEDRVTGYYIADNLLVVKESGSIQLSVRINHSNYDYIAQQVKQTAEAVKENLFFTLYYGAEQAPVTYTPTSVTVESKFYYDYIKICFDGVDLADSIPWYRLNIHMAGYADTEEEPYACILVYENNEEYNVFYPYEISSKELQGE